MAGNEKVDVLIIGSGASGAAVAWSLADTRMRILCLEQGDWMKPTDFPSNGRDWEARRHTDFAISPNRRGRDTDYPVNDDNSLMKVANFNGVGGGTVIYTAHWPRLHPSDFKVKSLDGVADDWPIDYWALERFYEENDRMMGELRPGRRSRRAAAPSADAADPARQDRRALRQGDEQARLALVAVRHHHRHRPTTRAAARCINLGHCTPGCAQGAKASTDITYWPLAIRAGVELRTRCRVREITTDEHGMASGAIYYDADGREQFQPAEVVILACNGVGTPRLLLNSASARFPDGLANSSGLVGKNLMLHPWPVISGYVDEHARWRPRARSPRCGASSSTRPIRRAASCAATRCSSTAAPARPTRRSAAPPPACCPGAAAIIAPIRELLDHRVGIGVACDDLPEEHNRVTLDPVLKDSNGIPAPKIDYTISENTQRMMEHGIARAEEILAAAGATRLHCSRTVLNYPGHLLGTARMGTDPERSVVNEWGRCHDVKNLFIVDGSVFVTGGGVNPTSTIQAVALYIADQMKQRLATLFD